MIDAACTLDGVTPKLPSPTIPNMPPLTVMFVAAVAEPNVLLLLVNKTVPVVPLFTVGVPAPDRTPERVRVLPAGALMVAAPLIAMGLLNETVVAPACKMVLADIVNAPLPKAVLLDTTNIPAERLVPPLYELAADKVSVLVPIFVSALLPLTTPPSVMLPALPPTEDVLLKATVPLTEPAVAWLFVNAPPLLMPVPLRIRLFAMALPFKSSTAPLLTVTALPEAPNAVVLPTCNVPLLTVVPPV